MSTANSPYPPKKVGLAPNLNSGFYGQDIISVSQFRRESLDYIFSVAEEMRAIVKRAYEAAAPDGEMHIIFEMMDDDMTGPVNAALFGLYEALMGSQGRAHSAGQVKGYMEAAGFVDVSSHNFIDKYIRRVTGYKRPD